MEKFKPQLELEAQIDKASSALNTGFETTNLIPEGADVFSISEEDLKNKYNRRYLTYVKMLRKQKRGEDVDQKEFEKEYQIIRALNNLKEYIKIQREGGTDKLGELVYEIYQTIYKYNNTRIHTSLKMSPVQFALKFRQSYNI